MHVGHIGEIRNAYISFGRRELFRILDTDGATIQK
jgi:hypothetical protein